MRAQDLIEVFLTSSEARWRCKHQSCTSHSLPGRSIDFALFSTTVTSTASTSGAVKYRKLKASGYIPETFSPVESGGYQRVFELSEDPKTYLIEALRLSYSGSAKDIESATASTAMDVKVGLIY